MRWLGRPSFDRRQQEKVERLSQWRRRFAWWPTRLGKRWCCWFVVAPPMGDDPYDTGEVVWLEWVERRASDWFVSEYDRTWWYRVMEYRRTAA